MQGEMAGASAYAGKTSSLSLSIPLTVLVFSGILLLTAARESCLRTVRLGFPQTVVFFFIGIRCSALANCSRVIPRACGESRSLRGLAPLDVGSPPRVRGKRRSASRLRSKPGITPARAGKTQQTVLALLLLRDHPRACGENDPLPPAANCKMGSPPRVRGKLSCRCAEWALSRITPARAGKTLLRRAELWTYSDHPRACGENQPRGNLLDNGSGSPPRVRGKRPAGRSSDGRSRITPARAGKTPSAMRCIASAMDHPRACGENEILIHRRRAAAGSPPRVRGKPRARCRLSAEIRITPARAGKTEGRPRKDRDGQDHPRACGENRSRLGNLPRGGGSPPRVRGKRCRELETVAAAGITPARAGKTASSSTERP